MECGKDYLAVLRTAEDGKEGLHIITKSGEQVADLAYDDQCFVDFGFYTTTTEMLWIETLNINNGIPMTTISTYDLNKREVSGMIHVQSQMVDKVYLTKNSIFVVATNQIIRYIYEATRKSTAPRFTAMR